MGQKLVVGPFNRGLRNDVTPFNIDNESFPTIINAYQWRGRVKRKRGTSLLGRLKRYLGTTDAITGNFVVTILPIPIVTGSVSFKIGTDIFTDPGTTADPAVQTLITNGLGTGTLDRVNGILTITGSIALTSVYYYPTLPVMGLEDLAITSTQFPDTLAFDTIYSYRIDTKTPFNIYDVSFYKNPSTNAPYVQKSTWTPTTWNGQDYQQFWTVNYQGALWATNGISITDNEVDLSTIGMQYAGPQTTPALTAIARTSATTVDFTVAGNPLIVGDFVFTSEIIASAGGDQIAINNQTGYVTTAGNTFTVTFPNANIPAGTYTPGIIQYLTNRSNTALDCLRWFDGDPVTNTDPPVFTTGKGWVNFAPPLNNIILFPTYSLSDLPPDQYYLVGARMIVPFKDRLLFLGPVVQTSDPTNKIYLQDTIIYSHNGTAYYTASYTGDPSLVTTVFTPILVPVNQTAYPPAYWGDLTGAGGFVTAGIEQPIISSSTNEDALIVGFNSIQTRLIYSGNDIQPFNFFLINSEYGTSSTFSTINTDTGVMSRGNRGFVITNQTQCQRIDLEIPDEVFELNLDDNGSLRFTSQRDYLNEWIYFTYPSNDTEYKYPGQTLLYNYRDQSWSIFHESYTTYGAFRQKSGLTWATLPDDLLWKTWNDPWNSGSTTLFQPDVIGGNTQGFVMIREDEETAEGTSLTIQNINNNTVTSPNHCLNDADYIFITGALGSISSEVNGKVFSIENTTANTFTLVPPIGSGTYLGGALIRRLYIPYIQTKQFPVAWDLGRKTRLGVQQYLLTKTDNAQIQLLIFLSQNASSPYNYGTIIPDTTQLENSGLIYSTVLYTCPESTNLGLTPANTNLQMPTAIQQSEIWHRLNTSLIGDTVQIGFTLSDEQMRELDDEGNFINQDAEIELHGIILEVSQSQMLS